MAITRKNIQPTTWGCSKGQPGRILGATYVVSDIKKSLQKYPFSYFLFDPPIVVDNPKTWGLCAQGLGFFQKDGCWHIADWIGESFYPNAADILEEIRAKFGTTRAKSDDPRLAQLVPGRSKRFLFHPRGSLKNPQDVALLKQQYVPIEAIDWCPSHKVEIRDFHEQLNRVMCASLHWQHVIRGEKLSGRLTRRTIGDVAYVGIRPPEDKPLDAQLAIIGWLPIDELHVVEGPQVKNVVQRALDFLTRIQTQLPIFLTPA